jgi:diguanylate cyclase (GGDEF)-like protein/PAS domain S-box-containing protein
MIGVPEAVRLDLLLLGGLFFLFSFAAYRGVVRRALQFLVAIWVIACIGLNLEILTAPSWQLEIGMILVGEAIAAWAAWVLLPNKLRRQRLPLMLLTGIFAVGLVVTVRNGGTHYMQDLVLTQIFESVAILYAGASISGWLVRLTGFVGFGAWALMYPTADIFRGSPDVLRVMYQYWDLPKYVAAFAMTLEIFEASRAETAELAEGYKTLYEDFRVLYENHPQPMWIYSPATERFLSANRAAIRSYGYTEPELLEMKVGQLKAPEPAIDGAAHSGLNLVRKDHAERCKHLRKDGRTVLVEVTEGRIMFQGEQARVVLAVDVTERDRFDQELFYRAHHDALTGLPSRHLLQDRIAQCLARSIRDDRKAVLLTIDVDHFKKINDTYGHLAGDECLKAVAARLQSRIRQVDTIARTGGEEFTAIVCGIGTREDAVKVANGLLRAFEAPIVLPECALSVTVSIGGAIFPDDAMEAEELRRLSDEALYHAKSMGRNYVSFTSGQRQAAR